ncbi:MAG: hypothetical protein LBK75_08030 [Oscillospiraceae bacterium]|nr:hypothetical protein [Oscillospiraceae bacterium]
MKKQNLKRFGGLLVCLALLLAMLPVTIVNAAGDIRLDPTVEYQTMEGWGTSICWWGNTVGTWIGAANEKSIAYGLSLDPPVENMEVRDAIIHMFYSPDALNMNMARFCVGGGDEDNYANTTITRIETMVPGWSIDMYGDDGGNNGGVVVDGFYDKPIREMNDYGQLYVLCEAARIRQEYCDSLGVPNDFVVEVFSNSPPWYMTESGRVTGAFRLSSAEIAALGDWSVGGASTTGNADNIKKDQDIADFCAYMAAAAKYMDNMLAPYGAKVDMVNPMNEPGCYYWGGDHSGNMWKQEGCNVSYGEAQSKVMRAMRAALDDIGMEDVFLTMGETSYGTTIAGYQLFAEDVKDITPLVGTHAYQAEENNIRSTNDINRTYLRDLTKSHDKTLWQVEVGHSNGNFITGAMSGAMNLTRIMNRDLKTAQVSGWMDWCPAEPLYDNLTLNNANQVSGLGGWGLMQVNSNSTAYGVEGVKGITMFGKPAGPYAAQTPSVPNVAGSFRRQSQSSLFTGTGANLVPKTQILENLGWGDYAYATGKSYYTHMNYSRFIKQGYTQIDIGSEQMVAFVSPDRAELVIVAFSWTGNASVGPTQVAFTNTLNTTVDLSAFPGAATAEIYRTTGGTSAANWGDSCLRIADQDVSDGTLDVNIPAASQVYTYVIKNSAGSALYARNNVHEMVNSEVVYTDPKYSRINKFAYTGLNTTWTKQMWHQSFPGDGTDITAYRPSAAHAQQFNQWGGTYSPASYTVWNNNNLAANPSRNAYGFSVRRATVDGATVSFTFDGKSVAIWGLLKDETNAADFSVAVDGEVVTASVSNLGTPGVNACLYDTGSLNGDGPHTLTITKNGAAGQLDIGNAKIGYDFGGLHAAIKAFEAGGTADDTHEIYRNALEVYEAPVSSQAGIDRAAMLLRTLTFGADVSIQKTNKASVTATCGIANNTDEALTVNLILAQYNGRGQLQSVTRKDTAVQEALRVETIAMAIPEGLSGTVKAYIWDAAFEPLCSDATYRLLTRNQ